MAYIYTTYDVICQTCKRVAWHGEIGEYPWSWQFSICQHCGGAAIPDLKHPTEHRVGAPVDPKD